MRSTCAALVLGIVVLGCSALSTGAEAPDVRVTVDGPVFTRDPGTGAALVPFSVRNTGGSTLYLSRCGERLETLVDRWEHGRWAHFRSDVCQAIFDMSPVPLAVGEERGSARAIHGAGIYRLRLSVAGAPGARGHWNAVSPPFRVE